MYNRSATTQREAFVDGSTVKKTYVDYLPDFRCHVQPLEDGVGQDGRGAFGKNWLLICDVMDIQEGDKVIIGDTKYKVAGIENYDFSGQPHLEVSIRTF